jgi:hypothetical protein
VTAAMPHVVIEEDTPDGAMSLHGIILGFSRVRAVWRFGFEPDSMLARAFRVDTALPTWVLANHRGTVYEVFRGAWDAMLPAKFQSILRVKLC